MPLLRPHEHPERITGPAPLVSVIVPTMNRPELLAVALESLCRQTFRDFEAVIVNDAGKDPLPAIEPFAQRLDILYISHETNKGLSETRNTGIRATRGRYITYLDDDDFYYEDHIEALVNTLRQTRAAVVYADANVALQREENGHFTTRSRRVLYSVDFDPQRLLRENITPVLCVMHEKRCLEEVGHFREYLKALEDWDLWMRMSRFYTFVHLPFTTSEYVWRKGDDTLTQDRQTMRAAGAHLGRIGRWMAQIPRIEELRARLGEAEIVCRAPETACELSVIIYMAGSTPGMEDCFAALGAALPEPARTEIMLIADGAPELAQTLQQLAGEEMTVIGHPRPVGRTLAHNHAAGLARGKRLLFLSPEVALAPGAIAHMQAVSQEHGGPAIVTARLAVSGPEVLDCCGGRLDAEGRLHIVRDPLPDDDCQDIRRARVDCAQAACLLVPAAVFNALGGFRPRYAPVFFEDADFCLRAFNEFAIPTLCALEASAVLPPMSESAIHSPAARVNAVTFAADWGKPSALNFPPAEWAAPLHRRQPARVTVLMAVHNGEAYLREAIDSILMQTLPEFIFLIIDDGSTDGTPAILEKYAREDGRIRIVTNESNMGISASRNKGLALIETPYIATMDGDDISLAERLALQLSFMESHPEIAAVGCQMDLFYTENSQTKTIAWRAPTHPDALRQHMYMIEPRLSHPGSMMRTAAVKEAGGYRVQLETAEDYDLWLRLLDRHDLCNLPETLLLYQQHAASISRTKTTQQVISHVLAMRSSECRRQGLPDPLDNKESTLEFLLSLLDPSQPSAYAWARLLTIRSVENRGKLLYGVLASILRHAADIRETRDALDLLAEYLHPAGLETAVWLLADMPDLHDDPEYLAVTGTISGLLQRCARHSQAGTTSSPQEPVGNKKKEHMPQAEADYR